MRHLCFKAMVLVALGLLSACQQQLQVGALQKGALQQHSAQGVVVQNDPFIVEHQGIHLNVLPKGRNAHAARGAKYAIRKKAGGPANTNIAFAPFSNSGVQFDDEQGSQQIKAQPHAPYRLPRLKVRRQLYTPIIKRHARAQGVPVDLALAVVEVESQYKPNARGRAGEIGLMQILPRTARYIGYKGALSKLYDPETNIYYGMKYLAKAHRLGGGSTCRTILKYNAGHGAKRMNKISRQYCKRISAILKRR